MVVDDSLFLDWNSIIDDDGDYVLLKSGEYDFIVSGADRGTCSDNSKLAKCPKITLTLEIKSEEGAAAHIKDDIVLHKSFLWKISAFLRSVGLKQRGKPSQPDWNNIRGLKGRAKIKVTTYKNKNDEEREKNEVDAYIDAPEGGSTGAELMRGYTPVVSDNMPF